MRHPRGHLDAGRAGAHDLGRLAGCLDSFEVGMTVGPARA